MSRAEYMRNYRAKKGVTVTEPVTNEAVTSKVDVTAEPADNMQSDVHTPRRKGSEPRKEAEPVKDDWRYRQPPLGRFMLDRLSSSQIDDVLKKISTVTKRASER